MLGLNQEIMELAAQAVLEEAAAKLEAQAVQEHQVKEIVVAMVQVLCLAAAEVLVLLVQMEQLELDYKQLLLQMEHQHFMPAAAVVLVGVLLVLLPELAEVAVAEVAGQLEILVQPEQPIQEAAAVLRTQMAAQAKAAVVLAD